MKYRFELPSVLDFLLRFSVILNLRYSYTVYGPSGESCGGWPNGTNIYTSNR
jgi:hypothetical protein